MHARTLALVLALLVPVPVGLACGQEAEARTESALAPFRWDEPRELFEVVNVVDGDTIHVTRRGRKEKLRLLSVDTEEKLSGRPATSTTKPETVYGQETANWTKELFAQLADESGVTRVGLRFPGGAERRDVYGRLLCHVVLADGTDFNVQLVAEGRSPYFMKYGYSQICHEEFLRAEERARKAGIGVWDPATNAAQTPGAPEAKRPYEQLVPWWIARAKAISIYRQRSVAEAARIAAGDDPTTLESALARCAADAEAEVEVFGTIDRFFDEDDGGMTVLFRSGDRRNAFRAFVPADAREAIAKLELEGRREEFVQNYLWVSGRVERGPRGYRMIAGDPAQWRVAGPEVESR